MMRILHRTVHSRRGIALVLTLGILALITLLLIAFVTNMRVENMASKNFNDLIKARQLAQAAVDDAVANIRAATPVITTSPTLVTYLTSPGMIFTNRYGSWSNALLYSTIDPSTGPDYLKDLNEGNWITGTNGFYPPPPAPHTPIFAGWMPVGDFNNKIQGRFAYWVDDESTKVNINVAGTRGSDLEGRTPSAIDLQELFTPADRVDITSFTASGPFDTLESVKIVTNISTFNGINQAKYYANQFYTTVNSSSPDLTPWGTKRMNLAKVVATNTSQNAVTLIASALSDPNMKPWFNNKTFADKYGVNGVHQIAANIIDFIDDNNLPTDSGRPNDITQPSYLGLEQTAYLNELVISNLIAVAADGSGGYNINFNTTSIVELWYMYTNTTWTPLQPPRIKLRDRPSVTVQCSGCSPQTFTLANRTFPAVATFSYPSVTFLTFQVSDVHVVNVPTNKVTITLNAALPPNTVTAIYENDASRFDYASISLSSYILTLDPEIPATYQPVTNLTWISACNDPRVKPVSTDWQPIGSVTTYGIPSLGGSNTLDQTVGNGSNLQGDGDGSCHILSGDTPGLPTASRDRGIASPMYPGELGYIHTGVPWRTFLLQPQPTTPTPEPAPPDWAVLDLFSATDTTNVVGRMNINAGITNGNPATFPARVKPLLALLPSSLPGYSNAAARIYFADYLVNPPSNPALGTVHGKFPLFPAYPASAFASAFAWIGEICESPGLVRPGNKSDAEAPVRSIANLITTRSNNFSIWAMAQSIKKVDTTLPMEFHPELGDLITGEVKVQAIVERYEAPPGPDGIAGNADDVKFRTKYFRYFYQ